MRELLYEAAGHYREGRSFAEQGDLNAALSSFDRALEDLHAVKPQRMRDILLAQVYLSRYELCRERDRKRAAMDLRWGYSYARTTMEPTVRLHAEELWRQELTHYQAQARDGKNRQKEGPARKRRGRGRRKRRS